MPITPTRSQVLRSPPHASPYAACQHPEYAITCRRVRCGSYGSYCADITHETFDRWMPGNQAGALIPPETACRWLWVLVFHWAAQTGTTSGH
jgi:hypothetical protein